MVSDQLWHQVVLGVSPVGVADSLLWKVGCQLGMELLDSGQGSMKSQRHSKSEDVTWLLTRLEFVDMCLYGSLPQLQCCQQVYDAFLRQTIRLLEDLENQRHHGYVFKGGGAAAGYQSSSMSYQPCMTSCPPSSLPQSCHKFCPIVVQYLCSYLFHSMMTQGRSQGEEDMTLTMGNHTVWPLAFTECPTSFLFWISHCKGNLPKWSHE
jgi:hypothetical protein